VIYFYFSMKDYISKLMISLIGSIDRFSNSLKYSVREDLVSNQEHK